MARSYFQPNDTRDITDHDDFIPRRYKKRKRYRCQDMMCGALDCTNCYPDQREEQDPPEDEQF